MLVCGKLRVIFILVLSSYGGKLTQQSIGTGRVSVLQSCKEWRGADRKPNHTLSTNAGRILRAL